MEDESPQRSAERPRRSGPLWVILGHMGSSLGHIWTYWVTLGPLWVLFGPLWVIFGHIGSYWVILGLVEYSEEKPCRRHYQKKAKKSKVADIHPELTMDQVRKL